MGERRRTHKYLCICRRSDSSYPSLDSKACRSFLVGRLLGQCRVTCVVCSVAFCLFATEEIHEDQSCVFCPSRGGQSLQQRCLFSATAFRCNCHLRRSCRLRSGAAPVSPPPPPSRPPPWPAAPAPATGATRSAGAASLTCARALLLLATLRY